jgi:hypothetical protein
MKILGLLEHSTHARQFYPERARAPIKGNGCCYSLGKRSPKVGANAQEGVLNEGLSTEVDIFAQVGCRMNDPTNPQPMIAELGSVLISDCDREEDQ